MPLLPITTHLTSVQGGVFFACDDGIDDNPCDDDAFNGNGCEAFDDDNDGRGSNEVNSFAASDFDDSCDDV